MCYKRLKLAFPNWPSLRTRNTWFRRVLCLNGTLAGRESLRVCPNCTDGCRAEYYCDGCDETLCLACYQEHNEDTPCHVEEAG